MTLSKISFGIAPLALYGYTTDVAIFGELGSSITGTIGPVASSVPGALYSVRAPLTNCWDSTFHQSLRCQLILAAFILIATGYLIFFYEVSMKIFLLDTTLISENYDILHLLEYGDDFMIRICGGDDSQSMNHCMHDSEGKLEKSISVGSPDVLVSSTN